MTETIPLYVITGATRCGKSTTAAWIEKHKAAGERVRVIHQDRYYKESSAMPKVSLQGAPYVRVSFWDSADSVDWTEFFTVVNAAINEQGPSRPTMVIVEGNQLVMPTLVKMATEIVCIGLDKWVCFERRLAGDDSRQCYLPYMIEMWREHVARFERFLASAPGDKVNFITQAQLKYLCAQPDKPSSASDAFEILTDACSSSSHDFKRTIENDAPYPPSWVPIDVTRDESFFGARLAPLVNGALPIDSFKRLYGALIGNALGDASGAWCEFHHQKPVVWADGKLTIPLVLTGRGGVRAAPPGAITDDFQMTLLALKCLVKNNMRFVPDDHVSAYVRWASAHPGGIGTNTRALFQHSHTKNFGLSLEKYAKAHRERHADKNNLSMSNGTLMRAAAFAANSDNTAAIKASIADAALSNDNPVSKFANAVYVAVLSEMVHANVDGTFIDQINTAFFNNLYHRCLDGDVSAAAAVKLVGEACRFAPELAQPGRDIALVARHNIAPHFT